MSAPSRVTVWTLPLRWCFVLLLLVGLDSAAALLILITLFLYVVIYFFSGILGGQTASYPEVAGYVLGGVFGQPLVVVGVGVVLVASVAIIRGAFRNQAWAHWGAMALIAGSTAPVIYMVIDFDNLFWRAIGTLYCAVCLAFLAAMVYAFVMYGAWGVRRAV